MQRIDALDQWCLQQILNIQWHDFVRNADVCHITEQPPLSSNTVMAPLTVWAHGSPEWAGGHKPNTL